MNITVIEVEYRKMILNYNNTPIYYNCYGQGPAVILLHGFLESSTMWKPIIPELSVKNTVITLDLPGFGKSGCIADIHTMELMASVVESILDHLNISSTRIIGHSMGGYIGLAFIEANIKKVEDLILLNSTSHSDSPERKINRNRALKVIEKSHAPYVQMAVNNLFTESSHNKYKKEIDMMKSEALTFNIEGIKASIKGMRDRKDRKNVLKSFRNKKTLVSGIHDPLLSFEASKEEALQTNSHFISLSGGHMSLIENTEEVLNICI